MDPYTLIIAEKPMAAKKIANAISSSPVKTKKMKSLTIYEGTTKGRKILVTSALGHLYSLTSRNKGWFYPVYSIKWIPYHLINKKKKESNRFY